MDVLLILLIIFIVYSMASAARLKEEMDSNTAQINKLCPPHQWFWQELKDHEGNKIGERIVCRRCGPLSKLIDGSEE